MENRTDIVKLRGHHLFCMSLFKGYGYDERFAKNMRDIIDCLSAEKESKFKIVIGSDNICRSCPNLNEDNYCSFGETDVKERDKNANIALEIEPEKIYTFSDIKEKLKAITNMQFESICNNCTWKTQEVCSYEMYCNMLGINNLR